MKTTDKIGRRKFVTSLGLMGVASLYPARTNALSFNKASIVKAGNTILKAGPYMQNMQADEVTIRWVTHKLCFGWVEYGTESGKLNNKAYLVKNGLIEANQTVHRVILNNLQPGRKYFYRICSRVIESFDPYKLVYGETHVSDVFSFETRYLRSDKVEFIVFNDIHDRPESIPHLLKFRDGSKTDFVFFNGDTFDYQTDEDQLSDHLLIPVCEAFASETPFIFSRGNHETRGKFARQIHHYFDGMAGENTYYSFQLGPLYAIILDSGEDKTDDTPVYAGIVDFDRFRIQQAQWLEQEIKKKAFRDAKFRIVFTHIPPYHSGDWHGTLHCREVWGPLFNKGKFDLLIAGHTHKYGIHQPEPGLHNYPIAIGGGPKDGNRTLIQVKVEKDRLSLKITDDMGANKGELNI